MQAMFALDQHKNWEHLYYIFYYNLYSFSPYKAYWSNVIAILSKTN